MGDLLKGGALIVLLGKNARLSQMEPHLVQYADRGYHGSRFFARTCDQKNRIPGTPAPIIRPHEFDQSPQTAVLGLAALRPRRGSFCLRVFTTPKSLYPLRFY